LLFQLSELEDGHSTTEEATIEFLDRILFWQSVLFSSANMDTEFIRMFCYHLYVFLYDTRRKVRLVASNVPFSSRHVLTVDMATVAIK